MNSRNCQPADLPSPSLCPTSLQKSLMSSRKTLRTFQGFWFENVGNKWEMVLKKRSGRMRRRIMKKRGSSQPTISSWLSPIRQGSKYENFKPSRVSGFDSLLPLNVLVVAKGPTICRKLLTWHHTHPTTDSFTSCIYLPWVLFKKTCWVKKTSGKSDAFK